MNCSTSCNKNTLNLSLMTLIFVKQLFLIAKSRIMAFLRQIVKITGETYLILPRERYNYTHNKY
jgi:hypothetical protein